MEINVLTDEDIRQIITFQLIDIGMIVEETHINIAINYYRNNGVLPELNYICNMIFPNNEHDGVPNNNEDYSTEEESSSSEHNDRPNEMVTAVHVSEMAGGIGISTANIVSTNNYQNYVIPMRSLMEPIVNTTSSAPDNMPPLEAAYMDDVDAHIAVNDRSSELNSLGMYFMIPSRQDVTNYVSDMNLESINNFFQNLGNANALPSMVMVDVKKVIKNIDTIPLCMYKNDTHLNGNTECLICYDAFVNTDILRVLNCTHAYHRTCLDEHFINETYLCPYCKRPAGEYVYKNL